jgi:hypothetical protein
LAKSMKRRAGLAFAAAVLALIVALLIARLPGMRCEKGTARHSLGHMLVVGCGE